MSKLKAPEITSLRIVGLGAHFLYLKWDNVGSNFYYIVDYTIVNDDGSKSWVTRGTTRTNEWFEDSYLYPNTKYQFRISTIYGGFEQSDWVYTEEFETFPTNAYSTVTMTNMLPNKVFVENKLTNNIKNYLNLDNDIIYATLMNENFVYDPGIANITNVENFVTKDEEYHEIQGTVERVCTDVNRTYLGYNNKVLYTFERWQNMAKVSNDGGQKWYYYQALTSRIGYPIARTIMYQNDNTSFLIGYDELLYGRSSDEVRFSSNIHWWSDDQLTFVRLDVDSDIPFNVLTYGKYTSYPQNIRYKVEAQAASEQWVYAVAEDKVRRILTKNAPNEVDDQGNSVKAWDPVTYNITGNPLTVVKKMDVFNGKCYALVTGEVADLNDDRRVEANVLDSNMKGVYRFDEEYIPESFTLGNMNIDGYTAGVNLTDLVVTFLPDGSHIGEVDAEWELRVFKGKTHGSLMTCTSFIDNRNKDAFYFSADIFNESGAVDPAKYQVFTEDFAYPATFELFMDDGELVPPSVPNGGQWNCIFGNTKEERDLINHQYSNMSTDGNSLFVSSAHFRYDTTIDDPDTVAKYDEVSAAVKYQFEYPYLTEKKPHFFLIKTYDGDTFERKPHRYFAEAEFSWMKTHGERCWIDPLDRAVVVNPELRHTIRLDPDRIGLNKEVWDKGQVTFKLEDIHFEGFSKYCNGIMIHKQYDRDKAAGGEIFGYYEFPYRVRDHASVTWKPEGVAMVATLQEQFREEVYEVVRQTGLVDPHLAPLITNMGPEAYFNDSNFQRFGEYYLQFLSDGTNSSYNKLLNLIRNKYPREEDSFEYLWSEIRRRNLYLDENKRDEVVRFFEANAANFYSSKGTADSYKFLFKLLYNADVDIEIESEVGLDYDFVVKSTNINQDLVGRTIYTKTGRANVTYIEREYDGGDLRWKVTIHNLIGKFEVGQVINSETTAFTGVISRGVSGKELAYSDIDYINRERSYYVMKIRSELNTARYRDDVIKFVHPAGFGFIGITLLTVFINGGLSVIPVETIVDMHKTYRWDAGLPSIWPRKKTQADPNSPVQNPEPDFDPYDGTLIEIDQAEQDFSVADWNNAADVDTGALFEARNYDTDEQDVTWDGQVYTPSERRLEWSPLFSDFSTRFSDLRRLTELRLKDDVGNPRDPAARGDDPTQIRINE